MTKKEIAYDKLEQLVTDRIIKLETENALLNAELALANAKLEVYGRLTTVVDSKVSLGFEPLNPKKEEGGKNYDNTKQ